MPDTAKLPPTGMSARLRMADVARLAGVSAATISRVLAGSSSVTVETRRRVEAAVGRTGYVVNQSAQGLRLQRSWQFLVVLPTIANPFFSEIVQGIEDEAQAAGFTVLVGSTEGSREREAALARQLLKGGFDGVFLLTGHRPTCWSRLAEAGSRAVAISEHIPRSGLATVSIDNVEAARDATRHLLTLGHRRIAFLGGPASNVLTTERQRGSLQALRQAGLTPDPALHVNGDYSIEAGARALQQLMALPKPPTGLFCCNDEMAIGAIRAARLHRIEVPRELSVVGFDDLPIAAAYDPPLTTVRQPRRAMGQAAARVLMAALLGEAPSRARIQLRHELIIRGSTGPASSRQR